MHRRSGSSVKGHYRNGKWISSHYRKGTYVSDYTKSSTTKHTYRKHKDHTTIFHLSKDEEKNRDRNIYILTGLEREKNRIKPPVYETYFKGTFAEELAYNRSYRLWSITESTIDIAAKYLARVVGMDKAKSFRDNLAIEYDKYVSEYNFPPFSNMDQDLNTNDLKQIESIKLAEKYIEKDAKRILVDLDPIYQNEYLHIFLDDTNDKLDAAIMKIKNYRNQNSVNAPLPNIDEKKIKRKKINIEGTKENIPNILTRIKSLFMGK